MMTACTTTPSTFPITTSTNLSIQRTATLLRNLLQLAEENDGKELPSFVQERVTELFDAHKKFVSDIDTYMHLDDREEDEADAVTTIIETCPEFLATMDGAGALPVHRFANSSAFPKVAEVGRKHRIGGEGYRGGLLMKTRAGWNALQLLTEKQSPNVLISLRSAKPPLLLESDVREHRLLHEAVKDRNIDLVKYMIQLDPSCLYHSDEIYESFPIGETFLNASDTSNTNGEVGDEEKVHDETNEEKKISDEEKVLCLEIAKCLIKEAISHDPFHPSIGGLFSETEAGDLVFHLMIKRYGEKSTWACIQGALAPFEDIPILHQVIKHAPDYCSLVLNDFPDSALARDQDNRSPLHVALESGMNWSMELLTIINANRDDLNYKDPLTGWPLFVIAGMGKSCDLKTIFFLVRKNPEFVKETYANPNALLVEATAEESDEDDDGVNSFWKTLYLYLNLRKNGSIPHQLRITTGEIEK